MAYFDFPLEQLEKYRPERQEPADFDVFWQDTLDESRSYPLDARFERIDFGLELVDTFDVTFNGFGGQPVKAWLLLPRREHPTELPCMVEYIGYGGGRGFPIDWLFWSAAGFAHLVMDTRGQGSEWLHGDTPDLDPAGAAPHYPGFMTLGIESPKTYYYRRLITDAVRAVEAARANPAIDPGRTAVTGGSQGGGLALAAAGLMPDLPLMLADVPFLCHYRRAVEMTDLSPYVEITRYCQVHRARTEQVFATLAYFDGMNFAVRAQAQALFSVGLMDQVCPPSTVYAAFNHYAGRKDIRAYPFNQHDGGGSLHELEKLSFTRKIFPL